jgi:hypothetical protein
MAKRAAKGQVSKGKARAKATASRKVKKAAQAGTRPKAKTTAAAKSRAVAPQTGKGDTSAPPSTDIRRAYKSRLLAGYIGTHGADSIPSSKK